MRTVLKVGTVLHAGISDKSCEQYTKFETDLKFRDFTENWEPCWKLGVCSESNELDNRAKQKLSPFALHVMGTGVYTFKNTSDYLVPEQYFSNLFSGPVKICHCFFCVTLTKAFF